MTFQPRQVLPSAALQSMQDAIDDIAAALPSLATITAMNDAIAAALTDYVTADDVDAAIAAAIASIIDTAPGALDTLNELAAALGDDANFASTVTTALAGKANTSHNHAASEITSGIIATARLGTGTADNTTYLRGDGAWTTPPTGVTDHGALSGLADDDHTQYHNDTRGDARYYLKATIDSALAGKSDTGHSHAASAITSGTMATARLGTGTADNTTFLRGDSTWAAPSFSGVQDVRLGTETSTDTINQNSAYKASAGYALTGVTTGGPDTGSGVGITKIWHKPIQKQVSGSWYTIGG